MLLPCIKCAPLCQQGTFAVLADVLGSAAAAIFQSCHKHSLNEIRAAAALNAFGAVLSACMKEPGMVLITGAGKEP